MRSDCECLWADLADSIEEVDVLVLNGDTFDFRWSRVRSEEETIAAALAWLERLFAIFSGDRIHFIQGNHDCLAGFREKLENLAKGHPVIRVHAERLRLERNLFLHGDCANRKMSEQALMRFRETWSRDRQRGPVSRVLYNRVDRLGFSRRFHDWYFPVTTTVRRVAHHLDRLIGHDPLDLHLPLTQLWFHQ